MLGAPLPPSARPAATYNGPPRLIVPTVGTPGRPPRATDLKVILLSSAPPTDGGALFWRPLGRGLFSRVPLDHVARAVYRVTLPPVPAGVWAIEYYIRAKAGTETLLWPPTAPTTNQTLVVTGLTPRAAGGG